MTFDCTALTLVGWVSGRHLACKECHASISGDVLGDLCGTTGHPGESGRCLCNDHTVNGVVLPGDPKMAPFFGTP